MKTTKTATLKIRGGARQRQIWETSRERSFGKLGDCNDLGGVTGPDIVCLEGNWQRPSHQGDGYTVSETMYTLNSTEVHAVAYEIYDARGNGYGWVSPTIVGDHQNRVTDYTAIVVAKRDEKTKE